MVGKTFKLMIPAVSSMTCNVGRHWSSYRKFNHRLGTNFFFVSGDSEGVDTAEASCGPGQNLSDVSDQGQTIILGDTPPAAKTVHPDNAAPESCEDVSESER